MELVHCYKRLTHRYNPGWAHLDKTEYMGTLKLTPPVLTEHGNGHDDGNRYVQYARIPAGVPWKDVAQALRDTLGGSSCQHEWDCCGCASTHVYVRKHGRRQVQVRTAITYNY